MGAWQRPPIFDVLAAAWLRLGVAMVVASVLWSPAGAQGPQPAAGPTSSAVSPGLAAPPSAAPAAPAASAVAARISALGPEAAPMTSEPDLEARLLALSEELRCLVCQNESLASSRAELADDLRREVRDLLREGKSDQAVKDFLVQRYGDFVLYRPELKPLTWLLWFGPFALLLGAVAGLWWYLRQRRRQAEVPPALSDEERARVDQWLKD